jgi:EmrB/QacA subfamily drug resistance transporter
MTAAETADQQAVRPVTGPWTVPVLSCAQLMFLLDATIVNIALPAIQHSMRMSGPALEWMVAGYSLPFGGLLLLGGRAGDIFGRRRVFVGGVILFTVASMLGGVAPVSWWLIACRTAQGIGAAAAYPTTLAQITAAFPAGESRRRSITTLSLIGNAGNIIGPLIGGVIVTFLSWRWVMFVNVPVGAFLLAATPRVLPETRREAGRFEAGRFDVAGALSVTGGIILAIYGLSAGATGADGRSHWASPTVVACLAGAVVALAAFVITERRVGHPLVPLRIFSDRQRDGCYVVSILQSMTFTGVVFFLTLFTQQVLGYSPLRTGVIYLPLALTLFGSVRAGAFLMRRTDARIVRFGGMGVAAAGLAWLSRTGPGSGYVTGLLLPCIVTYGGLGLAITPLTAAAVARVQPGDAGLASGLYSALRQVGGATGLAVLGTVAWGTVAGRTTSAALAAGIDRGFAAAACIIATAMVIALVVNPRDGANREAVAAPVKRNVAPS